MHSIVSQETNQAGWHFDNSYLALSDFFYAEVEPTPVKAPAMTVFNDALATDLGLHASVLDSDAGTAIFAGNVLPEGAHPIAQAYAGHQFGAFTILGDGRAILLGEHLTPDGARVDIQLKGSGQTPYSRRGDGRAALGPMLREYIISEAMYALGIPTTRSLAVVTTGEPVIRESILEGAILTRVASSHIRVGTFEYVELQGERDHLEALADYTINRHYPEVAASENRYLQFFSAVMDRQAALISKWMHVGFIHGVMNTDNMALSGETIDYGPCAFMDAYNPHTVFSSIDYRGRYAFGNQPHIAQWNLARFAEALLPLFSDVPETALAMANEMLETFPERFQHYWQAGMRAKLGLFTEEPEDLILIETLLKTMHAHQADYTNTFRALTWEALPEEPVFQDSAFQHWHTDWQARLDRQPQSRAESVALMKAHSPAVIPRNHRVEEALSAAEQEGDLSVMERLLTVLAKPYDDLLPEYRHYASPPALDAPPYRTFCGT